MNVRITALRRTEYPDLMARYENPIEHACDVVEGQSWISVDGKCPEGLCPSASAPSPSTSNACPDRSPALACMV